MSANVNTVLRNLEVRVRALEGLRDLFPRVEELADKIDELEVVVNNNLEYIKLEKRKIEQATQVPSGPGDGLVRSYEAPASNNNYDRFCVMGECNRKVHTRSKNGICPDCWARIPRFLKDAILAGTEKGNIFRKAYTEPSIVEPDSSKVTDNNDTIDSEKDG
jgi:hypothetical protein